MTEPKTREQNAAAGNLKRLSTLAANDPNDALVLNRLVAKGPDPLSIVTVMPTILTALALALGIDDEVDILEAINLAHTRDPSLLLDEDGGLKLKYLGQARIHDWSDKQKCEAAWLFLAHHIPCIEGYPEETTLAKRMGAMVTACYKAMSSLEFHTDQYLKTTVAIALGKILKSITIEVIDAEKGIVSTTSTESGREDCHFYAAYKAGHHVCRVAYEDITWWGTDGSVTLEEAGIKVHKLLSPFSGMVLKKDE